MKGRKKAGAGAQMPMEIIGIAVVMVALLLLVLVTTYYKNMQTQQLLEMSKNSTQCSEISSTISRMNSNRATTRETLAIETQALLRRVEGKPGGITIGEITCNYIGFVEMATGERDSDPSGTGATGITLSIGKWCFEKSDSKIVATQGECS